ncbi:MAG: universal stress protein [Thermodesulfovibrionales bacterium]|nr:universal stress protein [Thermodesulfovibrionales bacterium]
MVNLSKILVCVDGEEHTFKAEEYAITIAKKFNAELVGLHVVNPFLKKFTHEIYAINRDECRDHLDRSLKEEGEIALINFSNKSKEEGIPVVIKMRYGDPEEEILNEMRDVNYDIVVMGGKILKGWKERFESFNLSERVLRKSPLPILIVR